MNKMNVIDLLKRHSLIFFFILAYGIAWILMAIGLAIGKNILVGVGFFAPAISAIIMTGAIEGKAGIEVLISRLFLWRVNIKWYLIAMLAPILLEILAILTHNLFGKSSISFQFKDWIQTLPTQLPWLLIILIFLVLTSSGEELGWRGYAMPRLQSRYGQVWASLILGLLWAFWHLPNFWISGTPQYGLSMPGYVLATIGFTIIYTCIYNGTNGSVLLASLYHGASNLILTYGNVIFPEIVSNLYLTLPALLVLVILVVMLSRSNGFTGNRLLANKETAYR